MTTNQQSSQEGVYHIILSDIAKKRITITGKKIEFPTVQNTSEGIELVYALSAKHPYMPNLGIERKCIPYDTPYKQGVSAMNRMSDNHHFDIPYNGSTIRIFITIRNH